jgi:hypothetical protein
MPTEKGTPPVNDQPGAVPPPEPVVKNPQPGFYKGCWMSSPTAGMSITDTTIQTSRSAKPLRYQEVTDEAAKARGMHILEIMETDTSSELKKYISLEDKPNDQMQGRGYESLDDVKSNHPNTIYAFWAKEDCSVVTPLLKGAGAQSKTGGQQPAR